MKRIACFALLLCFATRGHAGAAEKEYWKPITWTTPDNVQLAGLYHAPAKPEKLTWILLHGLGSTKAEWDAFAQQLGGQGNGVFVYDARGHGESIKTTRGESLSYQSWQSAGPGTPWDAMAGDLASVVQMLQKTQGLPEKKIAVGGASLGANVALLYASQHPVVPALVLLSAGLEYAGIQSPGAYKAYQGRPIFIAASPDDRYPYASLRQLTSLAPSAAQTIVDGKKGHGVNMFDAEFIKKLLDWMKGQDGNRDRRPS